MGGFAFLRLSVRESEMTIIEFSLRLGISLVLGGAIGIERQWRQTRGVLKTNVLVCLGATMFVMLSVMTPGEASPTRIAAQVVSGIGFLGGGVILREGASVRGLNTAATLWCASAVGTLVGAGYLFQAYVGTFAVVVANLIFRPVAERVKVKLAKPNKVRYRCRAVCYQQDEPNVRVLLLQAINEATLMLDGFLSKDIDSPAESGIREIQADFITQERNDTVMEKLVEHLKEKAKVNEVGWRIIPIGSHLLSEDSSDVVDY
jgi:putative Mg2+ transporter-C (MgtC) family protein